MSGDPDREIVRRLRLRAEPFPVVRLSRRAVAITAGVAGVALAAVTGFALSDRRIAKPAPAVAAQPAEARPPEQLAALPKDYADLPPGVPRLGPPLPGDLGRPILAAWEKQANEESAPSSAEAPAAEEARREQREARGSRLFTPSSASARPAVDVSPVSPVERTSAHPTRADAVSPRHVLPPGHLIRAALVTGLRSDLPGQVVAQVTEDVFDVSSGEALLIPRGSRLLGEYDSKVAFGQDRVLLTWSKLVLPDGRIVELGEAPALDAQGYAGLQDRVDRRWRQLIGASLVSLGLGLGSELGQRGDEDELMSALRRGFSDTVDEAGARVVDRSLSVQPSLTVRAGHSVRVLLTRELALEPWSASWAS